MAKSKMALDVNQSVYADILIYHLLSEPDAPPLDILHMLDDASRFRPLELLENRGHESIRDALARWFGLFGPPVELRVDQESAIVSDAMKIHLEGKSCKLNPHPAARGGTTSSHTAAGAIESHNRIVRKALNIAETSARSLGL